MFNKISKRVVGIVALVGIVSAASAITYSIAGRNGNSESLGEKIESAITQREATIAGADYISNIDLIIENSNKKQDPEMFNIVEIVTKAEVAVASDLSAYVSTGGFKKYVIDAYSETSPKGVMKDNMISYNCVGIDASSTLEQSCYTDIYTHVPTVESITNTTELAPGVKGDATLQMLLSAADLIYVSSPTYTAYDNMMNDEIYNYLHTYALADYKPIILDYVTKSTSSGSTGTTESGSSTTTTKTFADLANLISYNNIRYRTFGWDLKNVTAEQFFSSQNGSSYLKFNTNRTTATGKVLVVRNAESETSISAKMIGYNGLLNTAYYGNTRPSKMEYTYVTAANLTDTMLDGDDSGQYDFIILEGDIATESISDAVYKKLKKLSEASKYILYDQAMLASASSGSSGTTSGGKTENEVAADANNYLKLMDLLVTTKGVARYSNVLPITYGFFTSLKEAGADGVTSAKSVTDIINGQNYRGSGTAGKNGKVFRVLEIQPCYPIDEELALTQTSPFGTKNQIVQLYDLKGDYYSSPSEVMFGVTADEVEAGTEYYPFELSKAKIAHALGLKMDQIQVDSMSTNELISSKDVLSETYDLIYIGGNTSALTPYSLWSYVPYNKASDVKNEEGNISNGLSLLNLNACFDMYTHTGTIVELDAYQSNSDVMKKVVENNPGQTMKYAYGTVYVDGEGQKTSVELNGNDITKLKYDELIDYIDAKMPIIIESTVASAFEKINAIDNKVERLTQHDIDPNSFMYQLLEYAYGKKAQGNVSWNLDMVGVDSANNETQIKIDNMEGEYGNTLSGLVTVFNETIETTISALVNSSVTRPTLTIVSQPYDYEEGNINTYNQTKTLKIDAYVTPTNKVAGQKYDMKLYVDKNGDGTYSDSECVVTNKTYVYKGSESPGSISLTYTLENSDYGMKPWKLVATEQGTGTVTIATGYPYFARLDANKKKVRVLQIMPRNEYKHKLIEKVENDDGTIEEIYQEGEDQDQNDGHSLYFCVECQQAEYRCDYNIFLNGNKLGQNTQGQTESTTLDIASAEGAASQKVTFNFGKHEHKFGICKYDSTLNNGENEDWEYNFADELSDDYDFDLTILYDDELEDIVRITNANDEDAILKYEGYLTNAQEELSKAETALANSTVEDTLIKAIRTMADETGVEYEMKSSFEQFIEDKEYYKVFYYNRDKHATVNYYNYMIAYEKYRVLHDPVVEAQEKVDKYSRLAHSGIDWLKENYDIVVLGFAEDFGGKDLNDAACQQLLAYVDQGGYMLNTHDTTTRYAQAGAVNITHYLRGVFGMDRFHITQQNTQAGKYELSDGDASNKYQRYATQNSNLYFWTDRILNPKSTTTTITGAEWSAYMAGFPNYKDRFGYTSPVGLTDPTMIFETSSKNSSPYKYVTYYLQDAIHWNQDYYLQTYNGARYGTDGASQVNKGIVTEYPFKISSELRISGTHSQTYALDMEDDNVAVWYTLSAGSSRSQVSATSYYAATPHDGMNSYYLYSRGNIFYCGAGHTVVTGPDRENNDERRLFINIIVRSAGLGESEPSKAAPEINLYNKDKEDIKEESATGKLVSETVTDSEGNETTNYLYRVESETECPEFDFDVVVKSDAATLGKVEVFYDLNYGIDGNTSNDFEEGKDQMIITYNDSSNADSETLLSGDLAELRKDLDNLTLKPEYFTNYGDFTYIVIKATDSVGQVSYKRIRIDLVHALFELTWNSAGSNQVWIDFTNRVKFEI